MLAIQVSQREAIKCMYAYNKIGSMYTHIPIIMKV